MLRSGEYLEMKNCFYFLLNSQCFIVEIAIFFNISFLEMTRRNISWEPSLGRKAP
ncbi:hypothetical protein KSP40_PGU000329 [Platanthera guangdongensis]|uniref:Uncharacterized protein n=1 Tax=Platanthera guangdongensis TaxID=2320717 RepID=A0ABR2LKF9_9ASPA